MIMRKYVFGLLTVFLMLGWGWMHVGLGLDLAASEKTSTLCPELMPCMASREDGRYVVWVFFADKGISSVAEYEDHLERIRAKLSARAAARRSRAHAYGELVDFADLPVCSRYVEQLTHIGATCRTQSRWLNGASISATLEQIETIATWPFVRSIEPVRRFRRKRPAPFGEMRCPPAKGAQRHSIDYGYSYSQLAQIHVPELHDAGYTGEGIRICVLDAGFDLLTHEALAEMSIIATWDFLEGDADVAGDSHGSQVLSVLGGYKEGELVGPAFNAGFLLARTEDTRSDKGGYQSDMPIEEDYWIAGIEWAEEMDADVVSSSLGYNVWDDGTGYTWDDLDGDTGRTTIAADIAASKGLVVVVSAGNEGNGEWQRITTPADGDSVIAVGAVDREGHRPSFSSVGPTADGRIKPDVVALGVGVYCIHPGIVDEYTYHSGTSYSCPLVAGVCALLLQVHPEWGPYEIAEALRASAQDLGPVGPDTLYGWGLVDAVAASELLPEPIPEPIPESFVVGAPYPNPSSDGTIYFPLDIPEWDNVEVTLRVFTLAAEPVTTRSVDMPPGFGRALEWDGTNDAGKEVSNGVYFYSISTDTFKKLGKISIVRR